MYALPSTALQLYTEIETCIVQLGQSVEAYWPTLVELVYSELMFCLPVFGKVHGLATYRDTKGRSAGMTVNDSNQLQILQNSMNRLITGARHGVATADLLSSTNTLSVQQMVAYYTLIMVHKITMTGKPTYLAGVHDVKNRDLREEVGRKRGNARGNQRRKKMRLDDDFGEDFEIEDLPMERGGVDGMGGRKRPISELRKENENLIVREKTSWG